MILVDSCVWIDLLRGKITPAARRLKEIQKARTPEICISSIIYFEVLRGISFDLERRKIQTFLDRLEKRDCLAEGFSRLVDFSIAAQRRGCTISKLGDWLILKTLLDHSLTLLTSDRDFYRLQHFIPFPLAV